MAQVAYEELYSTAKEKFNEGQYKTAETLLQQVLISNNRLPDVFYMLGAIFYEQGKFSKATRAFQRALEIDPTFSDASVGLSLIYNDLGRYSEGKEVFEKAQSYLRQKSSQSDPLLEEQLAKKHCELGELYFNHQRFTEALEQFFKALKLSTKKPEMMLKIVDCFIQQGAQKKALKELKSLAKEYPSFLPARVRLGVLLYNAKRVPEAVEQWEEVLDREPTHQEAKKYLNLTRHSGVSLLT